MKQPFGSKLLDTAARLLVPYILLFALYVLFHGHHSPGGGFQGGTILAAAVILIRLVRGRPPTAHGGGTSSHNSSVGRPPTAHGGGTSSHNSSVGRPPSHNSSVGRDSSWWGLDRRQAATLGLIGVLIYAGIGLACLFFGGNFLNYGALPLPVSRPEARSLGILGIEIGVTIGVMGTMVLIFDLLTDLQEDEQ